MELLKIIETPTKSLLEKLTGLFELLDFFEIAGSMLTLIGHAVASLLHLL